MAQTVFGLIFEKGSADPVYAGTSTFNIEKGERHVRSLIRKVYPRVREARITVLRPDRTVAAEIPKWLERLGGIINFSADAIARTRSRSRPSRAKKKAKGKRRR